MTLDEIQKNLNALCAKLAVSTAIFFDDNNVRNREVVITDAEACAVMSATVIAAMLPRPVKNNGKNNVSECTSGDWQRKLQEEVNEVDAARRETAADTKEKLAEELTDVITVCTSWMAALGYSLADRTRFQEAVNEKNERRGYFEELPELKPCPFCGSRNLEPREWHIEGMKFCVICWSCGAVARHAGSINGAIKAWNKRSGE